MYNYDSKEKIIKFKAYDYFSHLLKIATKNKNGIGEAILNLSGLSEIASNMSNILDPYEYNGKWENPNVHYNPKQFFLNFFPILDDEHRFLFLKNIIEKTDIDINLNSIEKLDNYLNLYGYKLIEKEGLTIKGYSIEKGNIGLINRESDISLLESTIESKHPNSLRFLDEAISNFGNAEYKSCIDNSRSLLETIAEDLGQNPKSNNKNLLFVSKEKLVDDEGNVLMSRDKIYNYWLENNKGANRYRLFSTVYSALSGLGTHGEEIPTKKDALMFLRIVEDILVWILI